MLTTQCCPSAIPPPCYHVTFVPFSEAPPPSPPPVVYSHYTEDMLRNMIKRLKQRTADLREKAIDPYATSPEVSPPVSEYGHTGRKQLRLKSCSNSLSHSAPPAPLLRKDDYIRKKEEERIAKEEADKKKAEEAAKKAEEKKKKDEEKRLEAVKKAEEEQLAEEARKKAKVLPDISCSCFDVLLSPIENMMDNVLGPTIDPLGEGHAGNVR